MHALRLLDYHDLPKHKVEGIKSLHSSRHMSTITTFLLCVIFTICYFFTIPLACANDWGLEMPPIAMDMCDSVI